jgi:hypothetical protein
MRILARSLIVLLPASLAGLVAWLLLPCQPERSLLVPAGTELLEFSRAGRYVVTFQREKSRLTLWNTDTGQVEYEVEMPCVIASNVSTNAVTAFYGLSADDRRLAITIGNPDSPHLIIVELTSGNKLSEVAELPPPQCLPRPIFSSDGRYLSYFCGDSRGRWCAVLYDVAEEQVQLCLPGVSDMIGAPTHQGKWLVVNRDNDIELWDVFQRRREDILPVWPSGWSMMSTSLSPDEQTVTALCFVFRPFPNEHIVLHRCDLTTRKIVTEWEYALPVSAQPPLWNMASSDPNQLLLIKTRDEIGHVVQDLLDLTTGKVLARYPEPVDMLENIVFSYSGQVENHGPGLIHSMGRTGEMGIDSERRVIVSKKKQTNGDSPFWKNFGTPLSWLGIKPGPPRLCLQFHSAETGRLLERVSFQTSNFSSWGEPRLALHPSQPLLAIIDETESNAQLQFWRVPPPRPWAWIAACGFAAGGVALLIWIVYSKLRKSKPEALDGAGSRTPSLDGGEGRFYKKSPRKTHETLPANTPIFDGGEAVRWRGRDNPIPRTAVRMPLQFGGNLTFWGGPHLPRWGEKWPGGHLAKT